MPNGKLLTVFSMLAVLTAGALIAAAQDAPKGEEAPAAVETVEPAKPAQPGPSEGTKPPAQETDGGGGGSGFQRMMPLLLIVGAFFLMYIWMGRGKRKEQQRRREMLSALKKGDKITTIGGAVGTVMEVREDEVTVKVDESGNVRMRFARWAIRGVGDLAKAENPSQAARREQQSQRQ